MARSVKVASKKIVLKKTVKAAKVLKKVTKTKPGKPVLKIKAKAKTVSRGMAKQMAAAKRLAKSQAEFKERRKAAHASFRKQIKEAMDNGEIKAGAKHNVAKLMKTPEKFAHIMSGQQAYWVVRLVGKNSRVRKELESFGETGLYLGFDNKVYFAPIYSGRIPRKDPIALENLKAGHAAKRDELTKWFWKNAKLLDVVIDRRDVTK